MALSNAERSARWRAKNPNYQRDWFQRNKDRHQEKNRESARRRFEKTGRWAAPDVKFRASLRQRYGLSVEQYEVLLAEQQNRCANPGCRVEFTGKVKPCVDHCHASKRVRGLLCHRCNTALGYARESPWVLGGLIEYLGAARRSA